MVVWYNQIVHIEVIITPTVTDHTITAVSMKQPEGVWVNKAYEFSNFITRM